MSDSNIHYTNVFRDYFVRNKNQALLCSIIKENRERAIILNAHHNIVEVLYFTGDLGCDHKGSFWEKTDLDWFGASYEILELLFEKYKHNHDDLVKIAMFCMHSKSKNYWWAKFKTTPLGPEIMASILGGPDEDV